MAKTTHFLSIPGVEGESQGHGSDFVGAIDITGWDWSVENQSDKPKPAATGTAAGAAPATARAPSSGTQLGVVSNVITFRKVADKSSIRLIQAMSQREQLKGATFTVVEYHLDDDGSSSEAFKLEVKLETVMVTSYSLTSNSSDFRVELDETWKLEYTKLTFEYPTITPPFKVSSSSFDRVPGTSESPQDPEEKMAATVKRAVAQSQSQSNAKSPSQPPSQSGTKSNRDTKGRGQR